MSCVILILTILKCMFKIREEMFNRGDNNKGHAKPVSRDTG